jgi:3-hydroxyisobutyrate dehydrogenase
MGGALATRLQETHPLAVYDRDEEAVRRLVAGGAESFADLPALAASREVVFLCLPTSREVREVLLGEGGLVGALRPGALVVDQTSGDPAITRTLAAELATRGVGLVDAPVSGGVAGAAAGTITIMAGGTDADVERALPILAAISPNVFHTGDVGTGHTMKLVNNLMSCTQRLLTFEAVALGAKNGIDPAIAVEILRASGGRNGFLEQVMGSQILHGKLDTGFTLGLAHKDVALACQLGMESGVPMSFGNLSRELYESHIAALGRDAHVDRAAQVVDRAAGTHVAASAGGGRREAK